MKFFRLKFALFALMAGVAASPLAYPQVSVVQTTITITLDADQLAALDEEVDRAFPVVPADHPEAKLSLADKRVLWVQREIVRDLAPTVTRAKAAQGNQVRDKLRKLAPARCRAVAKELGVDVTTMCGGEK